MYTTILILQWQKLIIFFPNLLICILDLTWKSTFILEKLLWAFIGITGTIWAIYFISFNFNHWNENPAVMSKKHMKLSDLKYPAMTICTEGSTKLSIAERLGNYLDTSQKIRVKLIFEFRIWFKHQFLKVKWKKAFPI